MRIKYIITLLLTVIVMLAACGGSSASPPNQTTSVTKVLTIWEENHTSSALSSMPYLTSLANKYSKATNYHGLVHPSLGNYLAAASGQGTNTCGLNDPLPSACPQSGKTVFGQAIGAGKTAKTYAESMNTHCQKTNSSAYAARHNPWVYFGSESARCSANDLPLSSLQSAITAGTLPNAGYIIPNLNDDAHDGTLAQADNFLKTWIPKIMSGPDYKNGRLAIVITFDEGVGTNQTVPFVLVHPSESGRVVTGSFNHYSLLRMYDDILGVAPLNAAANNPGLRAAFAL